MSCVGRQESYLPVILKESECWSTIGGGLPQGNTDNPELIAQPRGGTPAVIDTQKNLEAAARALSAGSTPIALDVERAQGFRYGSDPYLVQIRREDVGTFLIDTHALPDLSVLQPGVEDVWLLHDCLQDLPNLRQVGLRPSALFDTEIARASLVWSVSAWRPSLSRCLAWASSRIIRPRIGRCVPCRRSGYVTPPSMLSC